MGGGNIFIMGKELGGKEHNMIQLCVEADSLL